MFLDITSGIFGKVEPLLVQNPSIRLQIFWGKGTRFLLMWKSCQKRRVSSILQCHKSYISFIKLDGISHHSVRNGTFFISGSFPFLWLVIMKKRHFWYKLILCLQTHARCFRRPFCGIQNSYSCVEHTTIWTLQDEKKTPTETIFYHIHAVPSTAAESRSLISSIRQKEHLQDFLPSRC